MPRNASADAGMTGRMNAKPAWSMTSARTISLRVQRVESESGMNSVAIGCSGRGHEMQMMTDQYYTYGESILIVRVIVCEEPEECTKE
jgi:hypothetical protein